tara:strand:+ start:639 stop:851 length:213 start_codon:yes stop_codon:yes gene_type:complete
MKKILFIPLLFIILSCGEEPTYHPQKEKEKKLMKKDQTDILVDRLFRMKRKRIIRKIKNQLVYKSKSSTY